VAREARLADRLHEWGYRWTWPPRIGDLSPRHLRLVEVATHAEQYLKQEQRADAARDQPDHFNSVPVDTDSDDTDSTDDLPTSAFR